MTKNISDGKRLNKFYKPTKMESLNSITPAKDAARCFYFREATSQADMLACPFDDCRERQIPRCLHWGI